MFGMNDLLTHSIAYGMGEEEEKARAEKKKKASNNWHTGKPPVEEVNEVNPYCYVLSIYYDGTWYLCDYLYKAVHEKGYFESARGNSEKPEIRPFNDDTAWQKIKPF